MYRKYRNRRKKLKRYLVVRKYRNDSLNKEIKKARKEII
jgi:hypothetical protein